MEITNEEQYQAAGREYAELFYMALQSGYDPGKVEKVVELRNAICDYSKNKPIRIQCEDGTIREIDKTPENSYYFEIIEDANENPQ